MNEGLNAHLKSGLTTVCRCWKITRSDGLALGFTDHDEDLEFDGVVFRAGSGLSPVAVSRATGLSVDNSEALGALDSDVLSEDQIASGAFDGAEVVSYLVNWADPAERDVQFRGHLGEITRSGGQFQAEVRGLADALNQSRGRIFQKACSAILGDSACGVDLDAQGYSADGQVVAILGDAQIVVDVDGDHAERWFERGLVQIGGSGRTSSIKRDDVTNDGREITFWQAYDADIQVGTAVKLIAGCYRRVESCRNKFNNISNFRGFPDLPGEDWVLRMPASGQVHDGGSRR